MDGFSAFVAGLVFGIGLGGYLAWEAFIRSERPKLNIVVTPEYIAQVNEAVVMAWLDAKGLMWQPRGVDFKFKGGSDGRR